MQSIDYQTFKQQRADFDRVVAETPDIDAFCSSSYWILPAFEALFPNHKPWLYRAETTDGYVALSKGYHPRIGDYLQPMEASWGLAAPMAGPEVETLSREFTAHADKHASDWDMLFLSGIFEPSPQFDHLVRSFQAHYTVGIGPSMARQVASLEGGFDGYFGRRSSKFRSNMRRARRAAEEEGVEEEYIDRVDDPEALYRRILGVERNSWKAEDNSGIATGPMHNFYDKMIPMLAEDGALRVAFLSLDGTDIAYCFGGIFGSLYRGLQLSYHNDYRDLSAGNLAQLAMIEGLCQEGVETYDMGQSMDYKARWADDELESIALIVRK